ncbi:MAG: glycosyltransferase family 2 protein [Rhizobiales bacterium]|nr:glycosyltransferase family 2 protein [Hyphomicrobiales bacterium]
MTATTLPPAPDQTAPARPGEPPELSVIVPVLNEADNIPELAPRLIATLDPIVATWEAIFVDDGSTDATMLAIRDLNARDPRFRAVSLSRNFGKEIAIAAGLEHAKGRAAVIIDADLQHPPEMIARFVDLWRQGYENVYGQRIDRSADSALRRALTERFYKLFEAFGETPLPSGAGDFRLLDRKAIDALNAMPERARFSKGLYAWIGFKSVGVPFEVADRAHGVSKFSYRKLTRFALDGLTSFSSLPLQVWTYVGFVISAFAVLAAVYFLLEYIIVGATTPGFATIIISVMMLAGVQLLSLGVLGGYIGRIFSEVKRRPLYIVGERVGMEAPLERRRAPGN